MSDVDLVLAESDREIDPAKVARLRRSTDPAKRKKGALMQAVLDHREARDGGKAAHRGKAGA